MSHGFDPRYDASLDRPLTPDEMLARASQAEEWARQTRSALAEDPRAQGQSGKTAYLGMPAVPTTGAVARVTLAQALDLVGSQVSELHGTLKQLEEFLGPILSLEPGANQHEQAAGMPSNLSPLVMQAIHL